MTAPACACADGWVSAGCKMHGLARIGADLGRAVSSPGKSAADLVAAMRQRTIRDEDRGRRIPPYYDQDHAPIMGGTRGGRFR